MITLTSTLAQVTIVSQGYLDELASDGKTAPKASIAESSTFRIKCGDDGFRHVSFDVPNQSGTGDIRRARTEVPRVSHTGDNFASMSSVLNEWPFREMPNSRSCDEFSERLQFVLFTLEDPELNVVYHATAGV